MNALIHGLTAIEYEWPGDAERRALSREQFLAEWEPGSITEVVLIDQMLETTLRLEGIPHANAMA